MPEVSERSPREVVLHLRGLYERGDVEELVSWIVDEQAASMRRVLLAVERFLGENQRLAATVRDRFGSRIAQSVDAGFVTNTLHIFSANAKILDERIDGDIADVSFTIGGRLPVRRAHLRRIRGRWAYDPGEGGSGAFAEALNTLADGLATLRGDIESGRLSSESVRADPQVLVREFHLRVAPGIRALRASDD